MKIKNSTDPIVVLDDDVDDLTIFEKAYNGSGIKNPLKKFLSPDAFFQYLEQVKNAEQNMPAMLIIDINLGMVNGFDLVKEIRSDKAFAKDPTIMMISGTSSKDYRQNTKEAGANGYAIKPFDRNEFVTMLSSIYWV
jgi:DNA-binding response OmpR family regulator